MGQAEGLFRDIPSEVYHGIENTWSSSQLKVILEDEELFYKKYIAKTVPREEAQAFDVGTYFHTAVLEPHKLTEECVIFKGKQRRGADWEAFKAKHKGKAILIPSDVKSAEVCINAVKDSPVAMARIERSESEVSAFLKIRIVGDNVYAPSYGVKLGRFGWEKVSEVPQRGIDLMIKARADKLGSNFILDLKSTRGNAKNLKEMQKKVDEHDYELSAALYLDIFSLATGKVIKDFIWTFASKDMGNSKSWRATKDNITVGRKLWKEAVCKIAQGIINDWEMVDSLGELPPSFQKRQHLNTEEEIDL